MLCLPISASHTCIWFLSAPYFISFSNYGVFFCLSLVLYVLPRRNFYSFSSPVQRNTTGWPPRMANSTAHTTWDKWSTKLWLIIDKPTPCLLNTYYYRYSDVDHSLPHSGDNLAICTAGISLWLLFLLVLCCSLRMDAGNVIVAARVVVPVAFAWSNRCICSEIRWNSWLAEQLSPLCAALLHG